VVTPAFGVAGQEVVDVLKDRANEFVRDRGSRCAGYR
jgi:hypothetical protein